MKPRKISRRKTFSFADHASVVVIAKNESLIGEALRSLPDWILRAADKWANQEFECARRKKIPWRQYLPLPDPWSFLLGVRGLPRNTENAFRAARSWLFGLRHLCHMAEGFASLKTDWYLELGKAITDGNKRREEYIRAKLANKFVLSKLIQQEVRSQRDQTVREEAAVWLRKRRAQITHRCRGERVKAEAFDPILRVPELEKTFPLEYHLVEAWLCFPNGPWPGLMFWSNKAMTKWLFYRMGRDPKNNANLGRDRVKKTRQCLGLVPVDEKSPIVWDASVLRSNSGNLKVTGSARDGKEAFSGECRRLLYV
jgi:hypothetical protein